MNLTMSQEPNPKSTTRAVTQLRIERDLLTRAASLAERQRMSTNAYICNAVEAAVKADEKRLGEV